MSLLKPEMHPLLTEDVIKALFSKKIYTVSRFLENDIKRITFITDISHKDIVSIRNHFINKNSAVVQNGLNYYKELLQKSAIIPTGIQNVDTLLKGGLMTGNVYEVCSLPAIGKTQFCLTLAKNVVQKLDYCVYYIDTKRDFSGKKILTMLDKEKLPEQNQIENVMSKILVKQIGTKYDLVNCLYAMKNEMDNGLQLRLIIIDSLPPLFYQSVDYTRNYGVMNHFVNIMHFLAREYHVAFVTTNVITTWYEGDFKVEKSFTEKLGLGKYWFNIPTTRLMMKPTNDKFKNEIVIVKSNTLPKGIKCTISISNVGVL